jgi:hypothetical protein
MRKVLTIFILLFVLFFSFSCKKDSSTEPNGPDPEPPVTSIAQKIVVDSTVSNLLSTEQELEAGVFKYNALPGSDSLKKGDFLLEPRNDGYLRIVESITTTSGEVRISTTQGTIDQFYKDSGDVHKVINFPDSLKPSFTMNASRRGNAGNITSGIKKVGDVMTTLDVTDFSVSGTGYKFEIEELSFDVDPTLTHDFSILKKQLKIGFQNVKTEWRFKAKATIDMMNNEKSDTISLISKIPKLQKLLKMPFQAGIFWGHMELKDIYLTLTFRANAKHEYSYEYEEVNSTVAYVDYGNGSLKSIYDKKNLSYKNEGEVAIVGDAGVTVSIIPVFKIFLYRLPVVDLGASGNVNFDWEFNILNGLWNSYYSINGDVFGQLYNPHFNFLTGDLRFVNSSPHIKIFEAPTDLKVISGTDQTAIRKEKLKQPIVFQVLNSLEKPEGPVKVFFSSNFGKWAKDTMLSIPLTGQVSNNFTIGDTEEEHILTALIKKADGNEIKKVELKFKPTGNDTASLLVSHGTWRAYEGYEKEDGESELGVSKIRSSISSCVNNNINIDFTMTITDRIDSLNFTFNADGTGTWSELWYEKVEYSQNNECFDNSESSRWYSVNLRWQYIPELKVIRMVFEKNFYNAEENQPIDFKILSFSDQRMVLEAVVKDVSPSNNSLDFMYKFK